MTDAELRRALDAAGFAPIAVPVPMGHGVESHRVVGTYIAFNASHPYGLAEVLIRMQKAGAPEPHLEFEQRLTLATWPLIRTEWRP